MSIEKFSKSKIFLILILTFIAGIFVANFITINYKFQIFFSLFLLAIIAIILRSKSLLIVLGALFCIFAGFVYFDYYSAKIYPGNLPYDQAVQFKAIVDDYPDVREKNTKYVFKVINSQDQILVGKRILISLPHYPEYRYGDLLTVDTKLQKPEKFNEFDYEMYLARYNIFAISASNQFDTKGITVNKIGTAGGSKIYQILYKLRQNINENFSKLFFEPESGILTALILGIKRAMSADLINKLCTSGLMHIIVISGFHIVVIMKIFEIFTHSWSKKLAFIAGTILLLVFIVLTGSTPSVIRAAIMGWLFLLAPILGRRSNITNVFALTIFAMIVQNPLILVYDIGFQLSVLSVLGLIYIMPIFDKFFIRFGKTIGPIISATLSAQIATLPVIATSFGRISLVAPITNILVSSLFIIIIPYGIVIAIISFINLPLAFILGWPLNLLLKYFAYVTNLFSQIKFASINVSANNNFILVYFMIVIILVIYAYQIINKKNHARTKAK